MFITIIFHFCDLQKLLLYILKQPKIENEVILRPWIVHTTKWRISYKYLNMIFFILKFWWFVLILKKCEIEIVKLSAPLLRRREKESGYSRSAGWNWSGKGNKRQTRFLIVFAEIGVVFSEWTCVRYILSFCDRNRTLGKVWFCVHWSVNFLLIYGLIGFMTWFLKKFFDYFSGLQSYSCRICVVTYDFP